jgi:hypothetical protein
LCSCSFELLRGTGFATHFNEEGIAEGNLPRRLRKYAKSSRHGELLRQADCRPLIDVAIHGGMEFA